MKMVEKLRILMEKENLTASRLAQILDVAPATVSLILKGRNKPSFELTTRLVNRFPHINPYWLLGNDSEIYNSSAKIGTTETTNSPSPKLESSSNGGDLFSTPSTESRVTDATARGEVLENRQQTQQAITSEVANSVGGEIEKIIVLYCDGSCKTYSPR